MGIEPATHDTRIGDIRTPHQWVTAAAGARIVRLPVHFVCRGLCVPLPTPFRRTVRRFDSVGGSAMDRQQYRDRHNSGDER